MRFFRTSVSASRLRPRLPRIGFRRSLFGINVGSSVATRDVIREATGAFNLDAENLLGGALNGEAPPEEERVQAPPRPEPPRIRRRGPATLVERRDRLDYALDRLVTNGAHVEYQANTLAVIKPMHPLVRLLRFILMLPIIPIRFVLRVIAWAFRPSGQGKLNRTVVFVDRRGNVIVYKM